MKLKQFIGKDVRGYMNFDINFRESVTFLIGINGSGKTTVLKLLSGMLEPSYRVLNSIEFSELVLKCEIEDNKIIQIYCKKDGSNLFFRYSDLTENAIIEDKFRLSDKFELLEEQSDYDREEYVKNRGLFDNSAIVDKIKSIQTPLFLGINRRVIEVNNGVPPSSMRDFQLRRRRRMADDAVDKALLDIQNMVFDYVRQNAKKQSVFADTFRKKVVHDSFKFYNEIPPMLTDDYNKELLQLSQKRQNLRVAIQELGLNDLSDELDEAFNQLEQLLKKLSELANKKDKDPEFYNTLLKWMVNSSQLDKIDAITSYGNDYLENLKKIREPVTRFQDGVNTFFKEGRKELIIDGQGEIKVKISPKKINSVFELSSGEKQLVIMLAHLALNRGSKQSSIFIIDEPELSLHISWQELFVDALLEASPKTQFVIATHAPAILAKPERKEWCEDLSK